jgi:5'-methylthioadenosine nucleosidase
MKRIGLLIAMIAEARPLVTKLKLRASMTSDAQFKFDTWEGEIEGCEIMIKTLGVDSRFQCPKIGPLPAALATYKLIEEFEPELVLNVGSAGGFLEKGMQMGEVYVGQGTVGFHDRRGSSAFGEFCRGSYPILSAKSLIEEMSLKTAIVSTGSSFDFEPADLKEFERVGAQLRDSEAAAIAWVAETKGVPFLPLKLVTEPLIIAGRPDAGQNSVPLNYWAASENLARTTLEVIERMKDLSTKEIH